MINNNAAKILIRKATKEDIQGIEKIDIIDEILEKGSIMVNQDPHPEHESEYYYLQYINGKKKWCYVCEEEKKIIGFVMFRIMKRESFWKIKQVGYVDLLCVDKNKQRKGIARSLISKACQVLRTKKMKYITLSYETDNKIAKSVWHKIGFKEYRVDMFKKL